MEEDEMDGACVRIVEMHSFLLGKPEEKEAALKT